MLYGARITFPSDWSPQQRRMHISRIEASGFRTSAISEDPEDGQPAHYFSSGMRELQSRVETQQRNMSALNRCIDELEKGKEGRNRIINRHEKNAKTQISYNETLTKKLTGLYALLDYHEKRNYLLQNKAQSKEKRIETSHPDVYRTHSTCICGYHYFVFRKQARVAHCPNTTCSIHTILPANGGQYWEPKRGRG